MKVVCIRSIWPDVLTIGKIYDVIDFTSASMYYRVNSDNGMIHFAFKEDFVTLREVNLDSLNI